MNKVVDRRRALPAQVLLGCTVVYACAAVATYLSTHSQALASPPALVAVALIGAGAASVVRTGTVERVSHMAIGVLFGLLVAAGLVGRSGASGHDVLFLSFAAVLSGAGVVHAAGALRSGQYARGGIGVVGYLFVTGLMLLTSVVYTNHPAFFGYAVVLAALIEVATLFPSEALSRAPIAPPA